MLIGPCEGLLLNKHWIDSNYIKKQLMHCAFLIYYHRTRVGKKVEMVILQTVI